MKKILLSFLLVSTLTYAQFDVTDLQGNVIPNNSELTFTTFNAESAKLKFKTVNTTDGTLDIRVKCTSLTNTDGVGFQLCYGGLCHDNVVVNGVYPDYQNFIGPGQDNGPADYFVNNVAGNGTDNLSYSFEIYALDASGFPVGETYFLTYIYSPNLSFNSFEQLSNLGINIKNTISSDTFEVSSSMQGNVDVYALTGQKLLSRNFQEETFSLDLSQLNASYYLLVFTNKNGGSATIKVLKK